MLNQLELSMHIRNRVVLKYCSYLCEKFPKPDIEMHTENSIAFIDSLITA